MPSLANLYLKRKDEDEATGSPYACGPVEILPGIWLGSEENALDWDGLRRRGVHAILNVAREVNLPQDRIRQVSHVQVNGENGEIIHPSSVSSSTNIHYLKLDWSHGQQDLVNSGFKTAMTFVDAARQYGHGVLVQYVHSHYDLLDILKCLRCNLVVNVESLVLPL